MKVKAPESFTYRGGNRAVLLLHGFTGSTGDMKKLGKYLNDRDYTCHGPLYSGHGLPAEELVQTSPKQWWEDVENAYQYLKDEGYEEIAVVGISLGGVFSLKVGIELPVTGVVSMCAPTIGNDVDRLNNRMLSYAQAYKKFEGKDAEQVASEMNKLKEEPMASLQEALDMINDTADKLDLITSPTLVLQGSLDDPDYRNSASIIYNEVDTQHKSLIWYEKSGHIITLGKEREQVYEDVYRFLNTLPWYHA
ncbi:carboxylesterase [Peribacillus muralis]|uniref:Carboxylesterase n=1 Tax=Peribacillus muralis TaxID=264697 RepID=A0A1B3XSN2_9BACI|nr:alpha/beta fold hydrolase [Peribacillus muralis]AOH56215.1 carboxylesterase [Peribacillus muralis]